jgi:hypothetical protein
MHSQYTTSGERQGRKLILTELNSDIASQANRDATKVVGNNFDRKRRGVMVTYDPRLGTVLIENIVDIHVIGTYSLLTSEDFALLRQLCCQGQLPYMRRFVKE